MKKIMMGVGVLVALAWTIWQTHAAGSFDQLTDLDRQAFAKRFEKEIWPLLARGGKDGCIGCHRGGMVTALKLSGVPANDFPYLLREGFFIPGDPGNLHSRIIHKDPKRRMPPDNRTPWTEKEAAALQSFILDLDKKQQKK